MKRIIQAQKSVIVAADVADLTELEKLAKAIKRVKGIGGVKIGFRLGFELRDAVSIIKSICGQKMPVIYDHQKAGNDIPAMGKGFAEDMKWADVDAAIIFPFTGPETQTIWTEALSNEGVEVITGGMMTHPKFLVSEGGYIDDKTPEKIFKLACDLGVKHFVVPGNKLYWVNFLRELLEKDLSVGNFILYAPGFITQGGDISEYGKAAGEEWHAIVGSGIYKFGKIKLMREAAIKITNHIV